MLGPRGVFFGYDFHLGADGPQLIEINTNAGGVLLNLYLAAAQQACCTNVSTFFDGQTSFTVAEDDYIAQAVVPPSERQLIINGEKQALKLDIRCLTYNGKIQQLSARLYQGQTTNLRTVGGGLATVFSTPQGTRCPDCSEHWQAYLRSKMHRSRIWPNSDWQA